MRWGTPCSSFSVNYGTLSGFDRERPSTQGSSFLANPGLCYGIPLGLHAAKQIPVPRGLQPVSKKPSSDRTARNQKLRAAGPKLGLRRAQQVEALREVCRLRIGELELAGAGRGFADGAKKVPLGDGQGGVGGGKEAEGRARNRREAELE